MTFELMDLFRKRKREVTLVLGGGSARGLAHIGVLKVLEKEKISIKRIVGTSMGSLVGAAYALGLPVERLEEHAYNFKTKALYDPTLPTMGMLAGNKMEKKIAEITEGKGFRDCKIPLAIVATDIEKNEVVVYQSGNLQKIIRASCSWPGIFNPVRIDGRLLVDGGVKNSVPTKIAHSLGADYILAVNVGFCVKYGKIETIFQMILQTFQMMGDELNKYQAENADLSIHVDLGNIDQLAFDRAREIIHQGVVAAEQKIEQLQEDLGIRYGGLRFVSKMKDQV